MAATIWCASACVLGCATTARRGEAAPPPTGGAETVRSAPVRAGGVPGEEGMGIAASDLEEIRFEALYEAVLELRDSLARPDVRKIEASETMNEAEELYLDGRVDLASSLLFEALMTLRSEGPDE